MNAHTLHIGTNYTGTMSELYGCENDARLLFSRCKEKAASCEILISKDAVRSEIIRAFRKVLHRLEPGDIAFVSFSGHGTQEPDDNGDEVSGFDQAFVCADFELIYDDELAPVIDDRPRNTWVVALLDCCHSQSLHRGIGPHRRSIPFNRCKRHSRGPAYPNPRALRNCGFIAGCEEGWYSYDGEFDGKNFGALTYYTDKAFGELKRGATFNDLFQKVGGKRPKGFLPSADYPQQPTRMGSAKNFARPIPFI